MRVMAVASFGGHWIQLQRIKKSLEGFDVKYVTTSHLVQKEENLFYVKNCSAKTPLKLLLCSFQLFKIIFLQKPDVILSTGAAPGCLACIIGKLLMKKTIWLDSIANFQRISLSGRIIRNFSDQTLTQWEHLESDKVKFKGTIL